VGRKRYIVEIGSGADLHGGDVTKAAQRAVKDAISHSCLCGLFDILGVDSPHRMHVAVKLGVPRPEQIRNAEVLEMIPFGTTELEVVAGGLAVRGLELPELGSGDTIVIAVAALTVYVDVEQEVKSPENKKQ
jgi:uncharacterized protein (TIGR02058 family)